MRGALRAFLEPFVVPASSHPPGARQTYNVCVNLSRVNDHGKKRERNGKRMRERKVVGDAPLHDDDATFPPFDSAPHPAALLEVLGARVNRVQRRRFGLIPVGDESPSHGVHDERGLLRPRATDDGGVRARRNVVPGYMTVSVHPLIDVKCGISVELLDLVCLGFFLKKRLRKMGTGATLTCSASANLPHILAGQGGPVWG